MKIHTLSRISITVILLTFSPSANAYLEVIDLGAGSAYSINDSGQIVGSSNDRAVLFDSTGTGANIDLGTLSGENSSAAYSINNASQIVGSASHLSGSSYVVSSAVLFDSTGGGANINLGGGVAVSINDNGLIVGRSTAGSTSQWGAAIFKPTGGVDKIIGNMWSPFDVSLAVSVNNNGQIVGYDFYGDYYFLATLFDSTGGLDNINLGGLEGGNRSYAFSINNLDQIVGYAEYKSSHGFRNAVLFDSSGGRDNINLGALDEYRNQSFAQSINDIGQIVGIAFNHYSPPFDDNRAVLFDPTGNGNNIDLNTLIDPSSGWILNEAWCINNNGWIVGTGTHNSQTRAFLLTPEPASAAIMALGGAFLALRRRYR